MRTFEYFLFENFDSEAEGTNPQNPRRFLGAATDPILSAVVQGNAGFQDLSSRFGEEAIHTLINGGVLRREGQKLAIDCPIFLREDGEILGRAVADRAEALADQLPVGELRDCCAELQNGFSVERNLYHLLCGMIFDGLFFDDLSEKDVLATDRLHPSGLNYLVVIYERCPELKSLSDGLLCSYNRLVNETCALQSFGDACGNRFDFYRLFRLMEQDKVPPDFQAGAQLLRAAFGGPDKDALLAQVMALVDTGRCDPVPLALLERFGYARDGKLCVPVYGPEHRKVLLKMEKIVESCLGEAISEALLELAGSLPITAVRHGVAPLEIANELYHILFGSINEVLVDRCVVTAPPDRPGQGRYLQCIQRDGE